MKKLIIKEQRVNWDSDMNNHNILNKIADNCVQEKVKDELKKYYACYFKDRARHIKVARLVKAENIDEVYLKLFEKYKYNANFMIGLFEIYRYDTIIAKYIERIFHGRLMYTHNTNDQLCEMSIDEEDIEYFNQLKIDYIKNDRDLSIMISNQTL